MTERRHIYWSKFLTDQPGLCRFFRKHKILKHPKIATIKQVIIHLSKLLKSIFRKSQYITFLVKKWKVPYQNTRFKLTTVDYSVYWKFKIILSSIGFEWEKSVHLLVSEFFLCCDLSVIMFLSKGTGFHFPSMKVPFWFNVWWTRYAILF